MGLDEDDLEPGNLGQLGAGARHEVGHLGPDLGDAEIGDDRHLLATQLVCPEARLPTRDPGQAERVPHVGAVAGVEVAGRVAYGPGETAHDRGERLDTCPGSLRDPAVGRLQPEQPRKTGRDPYRPPSVAPGRDGEQASCDGCGAASGRASGSPCRVPRVARGPVQCGRGAVDPAELAGGRLGHEDGTGRPEPRDRGGVVLTDPVGEDEGSLGVRPASHLLELFHAEGDASEGQLDVRRRGGLPGPFLVDVREGVERRSLHRREGPLQRLEGRERPRPEGLDEATRVTEPRFSCHGAGP